MGPSSRSRWLLFFFFLLIRRPPSPTLFPYPPLFRSRLARGRSGPAVDDARGSAVPPPRLDRLSRLLRHPRHARGAGSHPPRGDPAAEARGGHGAGKIGRAHV